MIEPVRIDFPRAKLPIEPASESLYAISEVRLETRVEAVVPDVLVEIRGRKLAVEAFVTHRVEAEKIER